MTTPNNTVAGLPAKLLPCPFCGSASIDEKGWVSKNSAGPACDNCGASAGCVSSNLADNIAAWNRRASPAPSAGVGVGDGWALTKLRAHESRCGECGRAVWDGKDQAACIGFLAPCGKRIARLEDCGTGVSPALPAGLDLPSATEWTQNNEVAASFDWMAGWDACRVEYPHRISSAPWRREWQGSGDQRGFHIVEAVRLTHNRRIAYLGDQVSGEAVDAIIAAHNATAPPEQPGSAVQDDGCDCPGVGKTDPRLHAPNCPVRTTPPPAPAAEQGARSSEDVCDDCNGPNSPPWFAPSDLWNRVVGNEGGMLCPRCFIRRAQSAGVDGVWRVAPDATQPEARGVEGMDSKEKGILIRKINYTLWMQGNGDGCEPTPDWQEGYNVGLSTPNPVRAEQPEIQGTAAAWLWLKDGQPVNAFLHKPSVGPYWDEKGFTAAPLYSAPATLVEVDEAMVTRAYAAWLKIVRRPDGCANKSAIRAALTAALAGKEGA